MDVYSVKVELIIKKFKLFKKEKKYYSEVYEVYPILANSEEEAIEKFKLTEDYKKLSTSKVADYIFHIQEYEDIKISVDSKNDYTINQLKAYLSADDFMLYVKDKLNYLDSIKAVLDINETF